MDGSVYAEIAQLFARYNHAIDDGDDGGWAECFTADGVFELKPGGAAPACLVRGSEALRAYARAARGRGPMLHFVANLTVDEVQETTNSARCRSSQLYLETMATSVVLKAAVRMSDRLARVDGHWRIAHRTATPLRPPLPSA